MKTTVSGDSSIQRGSPGAPLHSAEVHFAFKLAVLFFFWWNLAGYSFLGKGETVFFQMLVVYQVLMKYTDEVAF